MALGKKKDETIPVTFPPPPPGALGWKFEQIPSSHPLPSMDEAAKKIEKLIEETCIPYLSPPAAFQPQTPKPSFSKILDHLGQMFPGWHIYEASAPHVNGRIISLHSPTGESMNRVISGHALMLTTDLEGLLLSAFQTMMAAMIRERIKSLGGKKKQLEVLASLVDYHGTPVPTLQSTGATVKEALTSLVPALHEKLVGDCPAPPCAVQGYFLGDMIIHLNDTHKWTREAIADWLDSLPKDEYDLTIKAASKGN